MSKISQGLSSLAMQGFGRLSESKKYTIADGLCDLLTLWDGGCNHFYGNLQVFLHEDYFGWDQKTRRQTRKIHPIRDSILFEIGFTYFDNGLGLMILFDDWWDHTDYGFVYLVIPLLYFADYLPQDELETFLDRDGFDLPKEGF